MAPDDTIEMTAGGDQMFHQHLEHCPQCRDNPFGMCNHGRETLRQAVEEGSSSEYNRTLDSVVNAEQRA